MTPFDLWLRDSRYSGYDKAVHKMLAEAFAAGGNEKLDRAAELLRDLIVKCQCYCVDGTECGACKVAKRADAFLRELGK